MNKSLCLSASLLIAAPTLAQDVSEPTVAAQSPQPVAVQATKAPETGVMLPANTEVLLKTTQEVTTKGKTWSEGDSFNLSVVHDVMLGDYVVIPAGTRGVGRITWLTNKGAFGKSGKMEVELEYLELNGRRINIDGTYRQEGEGNTVATVGGVLLAGVFAGFITGKSWSHSSGPRANGHARNKSASIVAGRCFYPTSKCPGPSHCSNPCSCSRSAATTAATTATAIHPRLTEGRLR